MKLPNLALAFGLSSGIVASAQSGTGGDWQVSVSPYLWLPGVHGTVGAFDRDANVSVSPGELLSHFRFGLMGTADVRWKRLVLPLDVIWARFADDKALPGVLLGATSADVKVSCSS